MQFCLHWIIVLFFVHSFSLHDWCTIWITLVIWPNKNCWPNQISVVQMASLFFSKSTALFTRETSWKLFLWRQTILLIWLCTMARLATNWLTHSPLGNVEVLLIVSFRNSLPDSPVNAEEHRKWEVNNGSDNGLMPSGIKMCITWTNVDSDLCRQIVPPG